MKNLLLYIVLILNLKATQAQWVQTNGPFAGVVNAISTSNNTILTASNGGVAYSLDAGNHWKLEGFSYNNQSNSAAILDKHFFIGMNLQQGLMISHNNGKTWKRNYIEGDTIFFSSTEYIIYSVSIYGLAVCNNKIFAATENGLFVSSDFGETWNSTIFNQMVYVIKSSGLNIALIGKDDFGIYHFYVSTDGGLNYSISSISNTEIFNFDIAGSRIFAATSTGGYLSEDFGNTWNNLGPLPSNGNISSIAINQTDILIGVRNLGVYKAESNGAVWNLTGPENKGDYCVVNINDNIYYCGTSRGFFRSVDYGITWTEIGFLAANINCLTKVNGKIIAGTDDRIFKTNNSGLSWEAIGMENRPIREIKSLGSKIYMSSLLSTNAFFSSDNGDTWSVFPLTSIYTFDKNNSRIFAAGKGVYTSTDDGVTWMPSGLQDQYISKIITNGDTIFVNTFYPEEAWYQSNNNGISWERKGDGEILGIHNNEIYVRTFISYAYSNNNGETYEEIKLPDYIEFLEFKDDLLFIGTYDGLYLSKNKGMDLIKLNAGIENITPNCLMYDGDTIYIGTSRSVWKRSVSSIKQVLLNDFNLKIFPNPVKDILKVETSENIDEIQICNPLGMPVLSMQTAKYNFDIDVSTLAKGVYFLSAINESNIKTMKFIKE